MNLADATDSVFVLSFVTFPKSTRSFARGSMREFLTSKLLFFIPRFFKVLPIFESSNEVPNHLENRDREQHALILDGLLE